MSDKYLVIRLTPTSPVDGAAFATYLEGLTINVYQEDASTSPPLLGSASYNSPLILMQEPGVSGSYLVCASYQTSTATPQTSPKNYGNVLRFDSTTGIPIGAYLFFGSFAQSFFTADTTVTAVTDNTITLSKNLPNYVPASTIASFIWNFAPSPSDSPWSLNPPAMKLSGKTTTAAAKGDKVLHFASTAGISFGMSVSAQLAGVIDTDTTVTSADATSVTLSKPLLKALPKDSEVDFKITLSSGIFQHVEPGTINLGLSFPIVMPAAVATAIIKLNSPPPLLNIIVEAQRGTGSNPEQIPVEQAYYNVVVDTAALPTTPDEYQAIPSQLASLYISLPPPPRRDSGFSVTLPSDGTAPKFDKLSTAMMNVLADDPALTLANAKIDNLTTDQYRQIAYDIVWSQQNLLPAPPDPLESLYSNPPNTGGSGKDSTSGNNDEQDRQKFEGTLNSFYATKKALAERLTKYVAAVSTAIYCEKKSLAAAAAVLEFPVDPVDPSKQPAVAPAQVQSELLLQGLSSSGINFGVPAAFFYALGANLDKSTSGDHRYQIATGDTIEWLLQEIGAAVDAGVIQDAEQFSSSGAPTGKINSAQAARRLVAFYGSGSSAVGVAVGLLNETNRGGFTAFVNFGLGIDRVIKDLMPR